MSTSNLNTPTTDMFTYRINNNYYYFDVSIINLDGRSHTIKPAAIKHLSISDKFQDFYQQGYIIIDNTFDMIERDYEGIGGLPTSAEYYAARGGSGTSGITPGPGATGSIPLNGFVFKGDCRDILRIDIMPSLKTDQPGYMGSEDEQKLFRMYFDFAIYHSEDVEGDQPDQKHKKLYFWDLYYEIMREQNTYFTTAKYVDVEDNLQNKTDQEKSIKTGIALKELIDECFNNNQTGIGRYPAYFPGEITEESTNPLWDVGSTDVFFSAPARYKVIDALDYLMHRHVSSAESNYDICFLRLERYPRVFTFTSLKSIFDKGYIPGGDLSGDYYLETLKIGGYTTVLNDDLTKWGYELDLVPGNALYLDKYGTFRTFSYSDISGIFSQQELTSRIVHSYDHDNKVFSIDSEQHDAETMQSVFFNNYGRQLKGATVPNFSLGKIRQERYNVITSFTTIEQDKEQRLAYGRNKSLYAGIFSNNVISFKVPGSTHRQAGHFIGIDRDGAMEASAYDNKLLGIYFILEVKHIFQDGEYVNELKCVKTYYANNLNGNTAI